MAGHPPPLRCAARRRATSTSPSGRRSASATTQDRPGLAGHPHASSSRATSLVLYTDGLLDAYRQVDEPRPASASTSWSRSRPRRWPAGETPRPAAADRRAPRADAGRRRHRAGGAHRAWRGAVTRDAARLEAADAGSPAPSSASCVLLLLLVALVVYFLCHAKQHRRRARRPLGPGALDRPERADRHGQPGDRRARLRARRGRGVPRAVQRATSVSRAAPRATLRKLPARLRRPADAARRASSRRPTTGTSTSRTPVIAAVAAGDPAARRPLGVGRGQGRRSTRSATPLPTLTNAHRRAAPTSVADARERGLHLGVGRGRRSGPSSSSSPVLVLVARTAPRGARADRRARRADPAGRRRASSTAQIDPGRPARRSSASGATST